jgi:hypothetical protein
MRNEDIAVDDAECRLQQARALLELFEKDHGRPAATMDEVRQWTCAQDQEHLMLRLTQQVHCVV